MSDSSVINFSVCVAHISTEISDIPTNPQATVKNVTIFGDGQVDRSPYGTGTSA